MTISSASAARYACGARAWGLSNLALQKTLYIAHMVHIGRYHEPLVSDTFEAWDYGPVLPRLYRDAAAFGAAPIRDVFVLAPPPSEGSSEKLVLDEVVEYLRPMTPGQLVNITHWKGGAWAKVYKPGARHTVIPNQMIEDEYTARQFA